MTNGTPSATTGAAIDIVDGAPGTVGITMTISRGSSCSIQQNASVAVAQACNLRPPDVFNAYPEPTAPDGPILLFLFGIDPAATVEWQVTNRSVLYSDNFSFLGGAGTGTTTITATITKGCSIQVTHAVQVVPCDVTATVTRAGRRATTRSS